MVFGSGDNTTGPASCQPSVFNIYPETRASSSPHAQLVRLLHASVGNVDLSAQVRCEATGSLAHRMPLSCIRLANRGLVELHFDGGSWKRLPLRKLQPPSLIC